jgi:hypothetical protein
MAGNIGQTLHNGQWRERRAQVLVDLKRFDSAIVDFDAAVARGLIEN